MNVTFESTNEFESDLNGFSDPERSRIVDKVNQYCSRLASDRLGFHTHAHQPVIPALRSQLESSLYSLRVTPDVRVIATVDDDPLFDQILVTLLRAVRRKDLNTVYRRLAKSVYQSDLASFEKSNGHSDG